MTLLRLVWALERLDDVVPLVNDVATVLACNDGDTIVAAGALHGQLRRPIGVWLELSDDYSAQMAARDVATLSHIVDLDRVVVAAATLARQRAAVVRALLSDDEVTFTNEVATLRAAYNRPAPPTPVAVWSYDGVTVETDDQLLRARDDVAFEWGVATTFA